MQEGWLTPATDETYSVAWGDVDNDGDLDLAVARYHEPSELYRNCFFRQQNDGCAAEDTYLSGAPVWAAAEAATTQSLAWGDVDNDGHLDLAIGKHNHDLQLYDNIGSTLAVTPTTLASGSNSATSLAWGDVNGDGWLDLVVGQQDVSNMLLLNQGNGTLLKAPWAPAVASTTSVALGDADGDGDLDLAVGNDGEPNRIYRNDNGAFSDAASWSASAAASTQSVAWHADGDHMVLAVGNVSTAGYQFSNQLYDARADGTFAETPLDTSLQRTHAIAWGDVDGDGDADLAIANMAGTDQSQADASRLYRNCRLIRPGDGCVAGGLRFVAIAAWAPPASYSLALAWADADNDGDLDLLLGNGCSQLNPPHECFASQLYTNSSPPLAPPDSARTPNSIAGFSVAWGDVDGDGDLDLAVGDHNGPKLFANDGTGSFTSQPSSIVVAAAPRDTYSLAWGDVDGDGDLDLAVGNVVAPDEIYRNDSGVLSLAQTLSLTATTTYSLAWGDVDGDGDLDLAVGNDCPTNALTPCSPNQLYRNQGGPDGRLELDPGWMPAAARSFSVAWGDVDGDGDLDLAVGNRDQPNRLYHNANGSLTLDADWHPPAVGTRRVAWGDVDGDGDLDLAVGNYNNPSQLYRNEHGKLLLDPTWVPAAMATFDLAWGDVDGDGDLDLATANVDQPPQLYRNVRGHLILESSWAPLPDRSHGIAWGDGDGDGDLDLALANTAAARPLYLNTRDARQSATTAHITRPRPPADASFYSAPQIIAQPTIPLSYTLAHPDAAPVQRVLGEYSLDGGGSWRPAIAASGTITTNLSTSSSGILHTYTWDLFASGVFGQSDNVVVRLIAIPAITITHGLPGPFQHGAYTASTNPFRVRGSQVRVTRDALPVANALVYRLLAGHASGAEPYADLSGRPFHTDAQGYLPGRGALGIGDQLIALAPIRSTDSYTLYATNAIPATKDNDPATKDTDIEAYHVTQFGVQTLSVAAEHPLLMFNLKVALEWDARHDAQFLAQLDHDLRRASEVLYDWTDGQVALGNITVDQGRQNWDDANVRIYATNRLRPNANKGGIVGEPLDETVTVDGQPRVISYGPGQLRIGAVWNRYGDPAGALGEDWPRTLAHELGHYLLFLDDNYIGLNPQGVLEPVTTCTGTAMADPYRDDYSEFHPADTWLPGCADTLSQQEAGRSDWATITARYPELFAPGSASVNLGPSVLPMDVTQVHLIDPPADLPNDSLAAPIFLLSQEDGSRYQPSDGARAFLFKRAAPGSPIDQVVDLGRPTLDRVLARGARPGDRLCVYDLGAQRLGCADPVSATDQQLTLAQVDDWQPDLSVTPVASTTLAISVTNVPDGLTLRARFFSSFGPATPAAIVLAPAGPTTYTGSFGLAEPAFDGYVQIWVDGPGPLRELVSDLTLIGSPAAGWGRGAPRGNPAAGWGRGAPIISGDGQVLLFTTNQSTPLEQVVSIQASNSMPAPPSWATVVGPAYRIATNTATLAGMSISFSYLGSEVPPGEEEGLSIYAWDALTLRWERLATALNMQQNNASAAVRGPGLYALMSSILLPIEHVGWNLVAYPAPTQTMPLALKSIDGLYTIVYGYEPSNGDDPWQVYDVSVPPEWDLLVNDLRELRKGRGYWINATQPTIARFKGGPASLALGTAGPLPSSPATYYGLAPRAGMRVEARIDGILCGQAQTENRRLGEQMRAAFIVDVRAAGAEAGCGTPDKPVMIIFLDGAQAVATRITSWDNSHTHLLADRANRLYLPLTRR